MCRAISWKPIYTVQEETLSRWDGETSLAVYVCGMRDATELDAYDQKTPENSGALLEQLILTMHGFTKEQCLPDQAALTRTRQETDYFLQQRDALRRDVDTQCQVLLPQMALSLYQDIEARCTQHLAGRFPFAEIGPGVVHPEATPAAIRAFYQGFDASAPTLLTILKHRDAFGNAATDILAFLQQLVFP